MGCTAASARRERTGCDDRAASLESPCPPRQGRRAPGSHRPCPWAAGHREKQAERRSRLRDPGRTTELKRRCEELEAQLKAKEEENRKLLQELEQKNAAIAVLENTVREREKKYLEELKLHAAKKKLLSSSGTSDASPAGSPALASYKPTPPKDKLPETPRRRMKKSLSAPLHPEFEEVYRFGAESRKLLLREPVDAMPDPTPFLLARESAEVQLKERPLVIPPIASDRSATGQHSPARDKPHKTHVGVAHRIHHATPSQAQPEGEMRAVDQVNASKVVRKHSGTDRTV